MNGSSSGHSSIRAGHVLLSSSLVAVLLALLPAQVAAHGHHAGYCDLSLASDGTLFVSLDLPAGDAQPFFGGAVPTEAPSPPPDQVANYLNSRLAVLADQVACTSIAPWSWQKAGPETGGSWYLETSLKCPQLPTDLSVLNRILFELPHGYRHQVVLRAPDTTLSARTDPSQHVAHFLLPAPAAGQQTVPALLWPLVAAAALALVCAGAALYLFLLLRRRARQISN